MLRVSFLLQDTRVLDHFRDRLISNFDDKDYLAPDDNIKLTPYRDNEIVALPSDNHKTTHLATYNHRSTSCYTITRCINKFPTFNLPYYFHCLRPQPVLNFAFVGNNLGLNNIKSILYTYLVTTLVRYGVMSFSSIYHG